MIIRVCLAAFVAVLLVTNSQATLISPSGISETTSTSAGGGLGPGSLIDGSSSSQFATVGSGADYFATGGTPPVFELDLGSVVQIDQVLFEIMTGNTNNTRQFTLRYSTTSGSYSGAPELFTTAYTTGFQTFALSSTETARYVELSLTDNFEGFVGDVGGDRANATEIAFNQVSPPPTTPEPSTLVLAALSICGLGLVCRRRRR